MIEAQPSSLSIVSKSKFVTRARAKWGEMWSIRLQIDSADQFDPAAFNPDQANTALASLAAILIKD